MDSYKPGRTILSCQIELDWVKKDKQPEKLDYKVNLIGVRPSGAFIRISVHIDVSGSFQPVLSTPS